MGSSLLNMKPRGKNVRSAAICGELYCGELCCTSKILRSRSVTCCYKHKKAAVFTNKVDADELSDIVDDCACDLERRTQYVPEVWDVTQEPAVLTHFDLPQSTLDFLLTLTPPPPVEDPVLPKHQRKCWYELHLNKIISTTLLPGKTLVLDLDETLVHSSLQQTLDSDYQFSVNIPDAGPRTVYVKVGCSSWSDKEQDNCRCWLGCYHCLSLSKHAR